MRRLLGFKPWLNKIWRRLSPSPNASPARFALNYLIQSIIRFAAIVAVRWIWAAGSKAIMPSLPMTKMGLTTSLIHDLILASEKRVARRFIVTYRRARKLLLSSLVSVHR